MCVCVCVCALCACVCCVFHSCCPCVHYFTDRVTLVDGNLRLVNVQTSDNGRYVCEANNTVDSVRSGPILIKVLGEFGTLRQCCHPEM